MEIQLTLKKDQFNTDYIEYCGYRIKASVPGDYDRSILYTAYFDSPFHSISAYHLTTLCEKIDKKIKENNEKGLQ